MSYRTEFPDIKPETMPVIPEGFVDQSYRHDLCPNFINPQIHLAIWIGEEDPDRFYPLTSRFTVNVCDEDGVAFETKYGDPQGGHLLSTDDWQVVLDLIEAERAHPKGVTWAKMNRWESK